MDEKEMQIGRIMGKISQECFVILTPQENYPGKTMFLCHNSFFIFSSILLFKETINSVTPLIHSSLLDSRLYFN